MRRIISIFLAVLLILLFAAPALAATVAQGVTVVDGNTEIGVIDTAGAPDNVKDYLRRFIASDRNMIFMSKDGTIIFFCIVPDNMSAWFVHDYAGWQCTFSDYFPDTVYAFNRSSSDGLYHFLEVCTDAAFIRAIYCGGTYADLSFIAPTSDYVLDVTGQLSIVDNGGLFGAGGGNKPWYEQLFDWLGSFWQGLLDFFISIFVPDESYFDSWFTDVRGAANAKFGAVLEIGDSFSSLFDKPRDVSFAFDIPANHFWSGSPSYHTDLLAPFGDLVSFVRVIFTAIICVITGVIIFRRLIVLFEQ